VFHLIRLAAEGKLTANVEHRKYYLGNPVNFKNSAFRNL